LQKPHKTATSEVGFNKIGPLFPSRFSVMQIIFGLFKMLVEIADLEVAALRLK